MFEPVRVVPELHVLQIIGDKYTRNDQLQIVSRFTLVNSDNPVKRGR